MIVFLHPSERLHTQAHRCRRANRAGRGRRAEHQGSVPRDRLLLMYLGQHFRSRPPRELHSGARIDHHLQLALRSQLRALCECMASKHQARKHHHYKRLQCPDW